MKKILILVIDGCSPEYLTEKTAPNLFRIGREHGFLKTVQCAMPSVTNVNHACILSGKWPEDTGIAGNYFYHPHTGEEGFIEERGYMKTPTILRLYQKAGGKTALFTVKGKILGVYGDGADIGLSAQNPDEDLLKRYGLDDPPAIQSVESTQWIMDAALRCIEIDCPDFVYCTTNDYVFHHFAPGEKEAVEQISAIDRYITEIYTHDPQRQIYITADHGMNQKIFLVNFSLVAKNAGYGIYCLPPLKDRYIENHIYQEGGTLYVFLKDLAQKDRFYTFAKKHPAIEKILTKEEAGQKYHLPVSEIGDFVLFSKKEYAFGEGKDEMIQTDASRTHGSLYECEIPLIAINPEQPPENYTYNKDIVAHLIPWLL